MPFTVTYMATSGDKVYPTPAQLRAVGVWVQAEGLVTGLDYNEGYDAHELVTSSTIALSITAESAKEVGHAVEDLTVELQVPTVNSDLSDAQTTYLTFAGLNLAHRVNVSIYGPHPALDHSDWAGTGGAATPNGSGEFNVTASGTPTLTLTIPNNFEAIQADAPAENFPEGGPSVPEAYWYHQADRWSAAYGAVCPKGGTWDATWEGVYCWRGWGWLLTRLKVPAASALSLTATGKVLTPSDNHYADTDSETGENRQTGYSASWASWSNEMVPHMVVSGSLTPVTEVPAGADQYVYWRICLDPDGVTIDPEVVNTLVLTGMADGDWQLMDDPKLVLDPTVATHCEVKAFEAAATDGDEHHSGSGYRKGGYSAVVDYVSYRALFCGDDSNANYAEDCIGMFDQLKSANTEIDYTSARTLAQIANIITYSADAWSVTINTTAYDAALKDGDGNALGCWAFDWAPLVQDVDDGEAIVAIRCGSWTIAPGIVCPVVTDKYIGGRAHGPSLWEDGALARSCDAAAQLWRQNEDTEQWYRVDPACPSNAAGHWRSANLDEVREYDGDTPSYWLYAVSAAGSSPDGVLGRAPFREYLEALGLAAEKWHPFITHDRVGGEVWRIATSATGCRLHRMGPDGVWREVTAPFSGAGYARASIVSCDDRLVAAATKDGATELKTSTDRGETWI